MPDPKIRLQKSFPSVLVIDDVRIDVRVRRLTNKEFDDYVVEWNMHCEGGATEAPLTPALKAEKEDAGRAWIQAALDKYFEILPGQIDDGGHDVTRGGELLDLYGGRIGDVVAQALGLIYGENRVSEKKKEIFRSRLVSGPGLPASVDAWANSGSAPVPTATAAEPHSSVEPAAATASCSDESSGTTDPLR